MEADTAARAGLPQPYHIVAGDMNAALFTGDVQRTELVRKGIRHHQIVKALHLHKTETPQTTTQTINFSA